MHAGFVCGPIASSHLKGFCTQGLEHPQVSLYRESLQLIKYEIKTLDQVCLATSKSSVIVWNSNFPSLHQAAPLHTAPRDVWGALDNQTLSAFCLVSEAKLQTQDGH